MRCSCVTRPATILQSRSPAQPGSPSKRVGADAGASTSPLGSLTNKSSTKLTKMMPASSITAAVQLPVASRSVPLMAGERTAPSPRSGSKGRTRAESTQHAEQVRGESLGHGLESVEEEACGELQGAQPSTDCPPFMM